MAEEGFFKRWSRLKAGGGETEQVAPVRPASAPQPVASAEPSSPQSGRASPTLDDVARLTPDADFSAFVGQGVDKAVQRLALKKLFADPHFKVMDGLDMYMDDYNKPSPVSAAMLAALDHARGALRLPGQPAPARADAAEVADAVPDAAPGAVPGAVPDAVPDAAPDVLADSSAEPPAHAGTSPTPPVSPGDAALSKPAPESSPDRYTAMEERVALPAGSDSPSPQGPA